MSDYLGRSAQSSRDRIDGWLPDRYIVLVYDAITDQRREATHQLDLFLPYEFGFEFKAIVTNKAMGAAKILAFHNGRGAQEAIFAQCKSQCQMDYVAVRRLAGNQIYLLSAVLAHNLGRELQMATRPPERRTTEKRTPLWVFHEMNTLRRNLIQRAGRLTRPQGRLTLTMSANQAVKGDLLRILDARRSRRRAA